MPSREYENEEKMAAGAEPERLRQWRLAQEKKNRQQTTQYSDDDSDDDDRRSRNNKSKHPVFWHCFNQHFGLV